MFAEAIEYWGYDKELHTACLQFVWLDVCGLESFVQIFCVWQLSVCAVLTIMKQGYI